MYEPWSDEIFEERYSVVENRTLVSRDRCYVLETVLTNALLLPGAVAEMGVYKGGTARLLAETMGRKAVCKPLYLFDTFTGMPAADSEKDWHKEGDFGDTSLQEVRAWMPEHFDVRFREGRIPESFGGLEDLEFCFVHVDLDLYASVLRAIEYVWPRLVVGGSVVFDDYGFESCPGARAAVDEFFLEAGPRPLVLPTGQAIAQRLTPTEPQPVT